MPQTENPNKLNRSTRLRKYGSAYKKYIKDTIRVGSTVKAKDKDKMKDKVKDKMKDKVKDKVKKGSKDTLKEKKPKKKVNDRPKDTNKVQVKDSKKRKLNEYQQFVKLESNKAKYKNMKATERLQEIAVAWGKHKKIKNKQKVTI